MKTFSKLAIIGGAIWAGLAATKAKAAGTQASLSVSFYSSSGGAKVSRQVGAGYKVAAFETSPVTQVLEDTVIGVQFRVINTSKDSTGALAPANLKIHLKAFMDDGSSVFTEATDTHQYTGVIIPGSNGVDEYSYNYNFRVPIGKAGHYILATAELYNSSGVQINTGSGKVLIKSLVYGSTITHFYWYSGIGNPNWLPAALSPSAANTIPAGAVVTLELKWTNTGNVQEGLHTAIQVLQPDGTAIAVSQGQPQDYVVPAGGQGEIKFYIFHVDANGAEVIDSPTLRPTLVGTWTVKITHYISGRPTEAVVDTYLLTVQSAVVESGTILIT